MLDGAEMLKSSWPARPENQHRSNKALLLKSESILTSMIEMRTLHREAIYEMYAGIASIAVGEQLKIMLGARRLRVSYFILYKPEILGAVAASMKAHGRKENRRRAAARESCARRSRLRPPYNERQAKSQISMQNNATLAAGGQA